MTEALLHTIWKYKLLKSNVFNSTINEQIEIISVGEHNQDSGPDFFNAKIKINNVVLVGNIEIHINSSDWLKHKHQFNKAYDNIILHVVFENDVEVPQNIEYNVPVIELKNIIPNNLIEQYKELKNSNQKIACGQSITKVNDVIWKSWLDRLVITRIEEKTQYIQHLFEYSNHNHEEALYLLLSRNFGFKINNDAFELLAKNLSYSILKKYSNNPIQIEALLFGVAGLLDEYFEDAYPKQLQNEFEFLKHKHQLIPIKKEIWKFSKTRPVNFPTIRLAQFASIFQTQNSLYRIIETKPQIKDLKMFFKCDANLYWNNHYKFDVIADNCTKIFGDSSFNLIVINVIIPYLFFMSKYSLKEDYIDYALNLLSQLPPELNVKTKEFKKLGVKTENALESQAQIQLFDMYCSKKMCLKCNVAKFLLKNTN